VTAMSVSPSDLRAVLDQEFATLEEKRIALDAYEQAEGKVRELFGVPDPLLRRSRLPRGGVPGPGVATPSCRR
jgi:hypothetical protein